MSWRRALAGLVTVSLLGGCYRWTERPPEELRALRAAGLRQADGGEKREREPPEEVRVVLRSGEVIRLREPFAIAEVEPGQVRVTDEETPVRTVAIADVVRVEEGRRSMASAVGAFVGIPLLVGTVAFMFLWHPPRSTQD